MNRIIPIASGKGGVGKSVIAANLGLALAELGKTVVLVDLDLGGSNLHTCLGVKNRHPGLGSLVWKKERELSGLLVETGMERLWLIPGDGLLPGTANMDWFTKKRLLKELAVLPADLVLLDLGAGSSYNVVDFFLAAPEGLLVVIPEITSILNAYSFLKTSAYRLLFRSFPEGSEARRLVQDYAREKNEGAGQSFLEFARELAERFPERGKPTLARLASLGIKVVMNRARAPEEAELGYRLRGIASKNLGIEMDFLAFLLEDEEVGRSVALRKPLLAANPRGIFSQGISALAGRLAAQTPAAELSLGEEEGDFASFEEGPADDLDRLAAEAFSLTRR